ncbi:Membrane protein involved in the export of O-antigen and teichoic acid [Polaribacter sp. KT25b]|uniref:polysaccharide biosynthesis C-terminal domain-containing protein n=1 Tax=Polaribacter sp. KT25b TaxID=1855336 RepID=UPI00087D6033|nr:polysaccharide biosynthesis C-terminal domain-containing protein [Polaribacter sp. KT25b]SDS38857.1 Membrane protein involved in the export of O-antigen and teichoic acid [Polaribacter sp. KT25b]
MFKTSLFFKLLNVFLRIGGIGTKFLIITLMSKYFDVDVFGNYGLITSIITLLIFILGLDFYNFSVRDILKTNDKQEIVNKVILTFILYIVVYLLFIILGYFILGNLSYIKPYLFLVLFLAITEHLSQEIYRLLIGFKKVLLANIILFFRTVSWSAIITFYYYNNSLITIEKIFNLWLIANVLTIVYVLVFSIGKNYDSILKLNLDFFWLKKGLKISSVFFIATISLKSMEYANRFIVDFFMGEKLAGIFLFYSNISILITVYVNTIVISFELPELIKSIRLPNIDLLLKKFKKSLIIHVFISSLFILLIIKPLLLWQNKVEFENYLPLIYFLIIGAGLMNYSLLYHFKLYIYHKDKALLKSMVISAVLSLLLTISLTYFYGIYGTATAFVISSIILFYMRYYEAKKMKYD